MSDYLRPGPFWQASQAPINVAARATPGPWKAGLYVGSGSISGVTNVKAGLATETPLGHCLVTLHERQSKSPVATTISDANGNYQFMDVSPAFTFYAVAFDLSGLYDATATQNLQVTP